MEKKRSKIVFDLGASWISLVWDEQSIQDSIIYAGAALIINDIKAISGSGVIKLRNPNNELVYLTDLAKNRPPKLLVNVYDSIEEKWDSKSDQIRTNKCVEYRIADDYRITKTVISLPIFTAVNKYSYNNERSSHKKINHISAASLQNPVYLVAFDIRQLPLAKKALDEYKRAH